MYEFFVDFGHLFINTKVNLKTKEVFLGSYFGVSN